MEAEGNLDDHEPYRERLNEKITLEEEICTNGGVPRLGQLRNKDFQRSVMELPFSTICCRCIQVSRTLLVTVCRIPLRASCSGLLEDRDSVHQLLLPYLMILVPDLHSWAGQVNPHFPEQSAFNIGRSGIHLQERKDWPLFVVVS